MCEDLETNLDKLRLIARMPSYWAYCLIIYFLLWPVTGTDLHSLRDWGGQGAITLAVTMFYICSHYIFVTLATNFQASKAHVHYPAGWGVAAALVLAMVFQGLVTTVVPPIAAARGSTGQWANAVFAMFSVMAFEWFYHRYVFRNIAIDTPQMKFVKIGSQDVNIDDLLYIQGQEHHVCMATIHGGCD